MSNEDRELERLKRIRDRQLRARDPQVKQRKIQRNITAKRRKAVRKFSLREILAEIPHKVKGALIGAVIGMVISIVLPMFIEAYWVDIVGIAAIFVLAIVGLFFGQAYDTRDSLKDLIGK